MHKFAKVGAFESSFFENLTIFLILNTEKSRSHAEYVLSFKPPKMGDGWCHGIPNGLKHSASSNY